MRKRPSRQSVDGASLLQALHAPGHEEVDVFIMKVMTTFYRRMVLLVRALEDPIADAPSPLSVRLEQATEQDLAAYRAFHPDQPVETIRKRFARGDRCFAVWDGDRIVHAAWAATERAYIAYLRRDLLLQPDEMYAYDAFTRPAYRGKGLCSLRGVDMLRHYRKQGYRRSFGLAALENQAGFAQVRAIDYLPIGMYACVRLGSWQRHRAFPFGKEALPVLDEVRPVASAKEQ